MEPATLFVILSATMTAIATTISMTMGGTRNDAAMTLPPCDASQSRVKSA